MLIPLKVIENHGFMREDFSCMEKKQIIVIDEKAGIPSYIVPESVVIHKGKPLKTAII